MENDLRRDAQRGCPHVDLNDSRCNSRFSLGRLDQAFCVCFGAFHACPMYHQINADLTRKSRAARLASACRQQPVVEVAIEGLAESLRPTGT